jgi:hypothetical protein
MAGGRRKYNPTDKDQRMVEAMAGLGMRQDTIARVLRIDAKTLRKHFRIVLDSAADIANARVGATLYNLATSGMCPGATIFWMKSRLGWRETSRLEHTGPDGKALIPVDAARALLESAADARPAEDPDEDPIKK